jgi:transaldolase
VARRPEAAGNGAWVVQQALVSRIAERFRPLFEASAGRHGYVSIQGSPDEDADPDVILAEAHEGHALAPNATPKIPATEPGLRAFEAVVEAGYPVIVTEVFSLAQLVETCERYLAVTSRTSRRPPFFLSPITGIFGDHLKAVARRKGIDVPGGELELVGVALSRACQRLVEERAYPVTLLCGGARTSFDLTGLVGPALHCTINWSTFADVLASDAPFEKGYDVPIDISIMDRLREAFPDVERALRLDGLAVEEFEEFGPVQHFRNNFLAGWHAVQEAIASERERLVEPASRP